MAIFCGDEINWQSIDFATVVSTGLATVAEENAASWQEWLRARRYQIVTVDCSHGVRAISEQLSELLRWQEQFGYDYEGHSLDALDDGFVFNVPNEGGLVLELLRPDLMWAQDPRWCAGLLEIASSHTRVQMAQGRRFFTVLVVPRNAEMIGQKIGDLAVGAPWSR